MTLCPEGVLAVTNLFKVRRLGTVGGDGGLKRADLRRLVKVHVKLSDGAFVSKKRPRERLEDGAKGCNLAERGVEARKHLCSHALVRDVRRYDLGEVDIRVGVSISLQQSRM